MTTREVTLESLDARLEKITGDMQAKINECIAALQDAGMVDEKIQATHMTPEQLAEFRRSRQAKNPWMEEIRTKQTELKDMFASLSPPPDKADLIRSMQTQIQQLEEALPVLRNQLEKVARETKVTI